MPRPKGWLRWLATPTFFKPDHYFEVGPWRREPGGSPIFINMIREVHNLRLLCGEIVAVQAIASHVVRSGQTVRLD